MGSALAKEYDLEQEQCCSGGLDYKYAIYNAIEKATKRKVSIFRFNKKALPKELKTDSYYTLFKNEVNKGVTLKHPAILNVLKPPKEDKSEMVFVAERVVMSLGNAIEYLDGFKDDVPPHILNADLTELEIKTGFSQIAEALLFLHREAKLYHLNVNPCNIYLTESGDWKLFGFNFVREVSGTEDIGIEWDFTNDKLLPFIPSFQCLAPELVMNGVASNKSDAFGLGRTMIQVQRYKAGVRQETKMADCAEFRRMINNLSGSIDTTKMKDSLKQILRRVLVKDHTMRLDISEFINGKYFSDIVVRCIRYLDKLLEKEVKSRISFLKRLPEVLELFENKTIVHRVIPPLTLQMQDPKFANFVLPSMIKLCHKLSKEEYRTHLEGPMRKFWIQHDQQQIMFLLLKELPIFMEKSTEDVKKQFIMPHVVKCLEMRHVSIQATALKQIAALAPKGLFAFSDLKNLILPRVRVVCCLDAPGNPKVLSLRVNALMCLSKIFKTFDMETINAQVLGTVDRALKIGQETAVVMSCAGVLDQVGKHFSAQGTAEQVLPRLMPLLVSPSLSSKQFNMLMTMARNFLKEVEKARTQELNKKEYVDKSHETIASDPMSDFQTMDDILGADSGDLKAGGDSDPFSDWGMADSKPVVSPPAATASSHRKPKPAAAVKNDPTLPKRDVASDRFGGFDGVDAHKPRPKPKPASQTKAEFDGFAPLAINPTSKKSKPAKKPKPAASPSNAFSGFSSPTSSTNSGNMFSGMNASSSSSSNMFSGVNQPSTASSSNSGDIFAGLGAKQENSSDVFASLKNNQPSSSGDMFSGLGNNQTSTNNSSSNSNMFSGMSTSSSDPFAGLSTNQSASNSFSGFNNSNSNQPASNSFSGFNNSNSNQPATNTFSGFNNTNSNQPANTFSGFNNTTSNQPAINTFSGFNNSSSNNNMFNGLNSNPQQNQFGASNDMFGGLNQNQNTNMFSGMNQQPNNNAFGFNQQQQELNSDPFADFM